MRTARYTAQLESPLNSVCYTSLVPLRSFCLPVHHHHRPVSSAPSKTHPSCGRDGSHPRSHHRGGTRNRGAVLKKLCNTSCCVCLVAQPARPSSPPPSISANACSVASSEKVDETRSRRSRRVHEGGCGKCRADASHSQTPGVGYRWIIERESTV
jgi:hypothetical protein